MKRVAAAVLAGAATLVLGVATAGPAQADQIYHRMTNNGGWLQFWPNGDIAKVCDTKSDGARAILYVTDWTQNNYKYKASAVGDGDCTTVRASTASRYNLREGNCFQFVLETFDSSAGHSVDRKQAFWRNTNNSIQRCA